MTKRLDDLQWMEDFISWTPPDRTADIIADSILIPEGRLFIVGEPKSWKSGMALYTGYAIATGSDWFGYKTNNAAVFIFQTELPKAQYWKRVNKFMRGVKVARPKRRISFKSHTALKLDTVHGLNSLSLDIGRIKSEMDADHLVVVLDPLYQLLSGDISNTRDAERLESYIDEIKDKFSVSFIIIHHTRKTHFTNEGEPIDAGSQEATGSSYFLNWADTMMKLQLQNPLEKGGASNLVKCKFTLTRNAERPLGGFTVRWNRANLQPTVVEREQIFEEPELDPEGPSCRLEEP